MTKDYTSQLRLEYEELRKKVRSGMLPLVARVPAIEEAVGEYVRALDDEFERKRAKAIAEGRSVNTVPIPYRDERLLDQLADLLNYEYLTWSHHDKMNIVENPILSDSQTNYRRRKETTLSDVYTGKGDATIGRKRGSDGVKSRIYDYMTPKRDMALVPTRYLDLYDALDNAGLTARQRQAIDLVYFEGMTQEDAAEAMEASRATLRVNLERSFAKIKKKYEIMSPL